MKMKKLLCNSYSVKCAPVTLLRQIELRAISYRAIKLSMLIGCWSIELLLALLG